MQHEEATLENEALAARFETVPTSIRGVALFPLDKHNVFVIRASDSGEEILLSLWQYTGGEDFAKQVWEKPVDFKEGQVQAGAWPELGVLVQRTADSFFAWDKSGNPVDLKIKEDGAGWGKPESMLFWKGNMHIGFQDGHIGVWNRDGVLVATLEQHKHPVGTLLAWGDVMVSVDEANIFAKEENFLYWNDKYEVLLNGTSKSSDSYATQERSWTVWRDRLWEFLCHDNEGSDIRTYDREGKCHPEGASEQLNRELEVALPWGDDTLVVAFLGTQDVMVLDAAGTNVGVIMESWSGAQFSSVIVWGDDSLLAIDEDGSVVSFKKKN